MISGSCLCEKVTYKITGRIGDIIHCHCKTCRKAHGAAFSSVASVQNDEFEVIGREHLQSFESSQGKHRYFCSNCGTQVYAQRENAEHVILRLGSLDDDPLSPETKHIWVSEKASWYSINSHLPEMDKFE
ncbi:GFA family protein [Thalassolituus oleivorans]|nr:GFA family protein [Thalassolituus oleivorans]MDF1642256.1 GFA family protein [Thalassolituus oleivorans]